MIITRKQAEFYNFACIRLAEKSKNAQKFILAKSATFKIINGGNLRNLIAGICELRNPIASKLEILIIQFSEYCL